MIGDLLRHYAELRMVVQLLDIRHKPSPDDIAFRKLLVDDNIPNLAIANKADKLKRYQIPKSNALIAKTLCLDREPIPHSSLKKTGKSQIWQEIRTYLADPVR